MKTPIGACALAGALILSFQASIAQQTRMVAPKGTGGTALDVQNICDPPYHKVFVNGTWTCALGGTVVKGNLGGPALQAKASHPVKGNPQNDVQNICDPPLHKVFVNGVPTCVNGNGLPVKGVLGGPAQPQ